LQSQIRSQAAMQEEKQALAKPRWAAAREESEVRKVLKGVHRFAQPQAESARVAR